MSKPKEILEEDEAITNPDAYDETACYLVSELRDNANHAVGSVLTILEAVITDSKQLEAVKSLVRKEIYLMVDRNQGKVYERAKMQRSGLTPKAYIEFKDSNGNYEAHTIRG